MHTDPVTKESFEPVHNEHFFKSLTELDTFIRGMDSLKELKPVKKEIHWKPQKRIDPKTGNEFLATHPAQVYETEATTPTKTRGRPKKKRAPASFFEPKVKDCDNCGRHFIATKPAMKYCSECSGSGGELVKL